jgi:hypothetical protein
MPSKERRQVVGEFRVSWSKISGKLRRDVVCRLGRHPDARPKMTGADLRGDRSVD